MPKLPAPVEEDLSKGILESIDMDSYRVEKKATVRIQLADEDAEIDPLPDTGGASCRNPNSTASRTSSRPSTSSSGISAGEDEDRVRRLITKEIPAKVAEDSAYRNARENSDRQNARIEHDEA